MLTERDSFSLNMQKFCRQKLVAKHCLLNGGKRHLLNFVWPGWFIVVLIVTLIIILIVSEKRYTFFLVF